MGSTTGGAIALANPVVGAKHGAVAAAVVTIDTVIATNIGTMIDTTIDTTIAMIAVILGTTVAMIASTSGKMRGTAAIVATTSDMTVALGRAWTPVVASLVSLSRSAYPDWGGPTATARTRATHR